MLGTSSSHVVVVVAVVVDIHNRGMNRRMNGLFPTSGFRSDEVNSLAPGW